MTVLFPGVRPKVPSIAVILNRFTRLTHTGYIKVLACNDLLGEENTLLQTPSFAVHAPRPVIRLRID